jgi:hypothetical protein
MRLTLGPKGAVLSAKLTAFGIHTPRRHVGAGSENHEPRSQRARRRHGGDISLAHRSRIAAHQSARATVAADSPGM